MPDIDVATGLPALPDGHRWVVREQKARQSYFSYPTGKLVICVERAELVDSYSTRHFRRKFLRTEEVWIDTPLCPEVEIQGRHPIAVLNAAHRCLNLWKAAEERHQLLGVYPPKKLVLPA